MFYKALFKLTEQIRDKVRGNHESEVYGLGEKVYICDDLTKMMDKFAK